jgi:hypothetical protein
MKNKSVYFWFSFPFLIYLLAGNLRGQDFTAWRNVADTGIQWRQQLGNFIPAYQKYDHAFQLKNNTAKAIAFSYRFFDKLGSEVKGKMVLKAGEVGTVGGYLKTGEGWISCEIWLEEEGSPNLNYSIIGQWLCKYDNGNEELRTFKGDALEGISIVRAPSIKSEGRTLFPNSASAYADENDSYCYENPAGGCLSPTKYTYKVIGKKILMYTESDNDQVTEGDFLSADTIEVKIMSPDWNGRFTGKKIR